MHDVNTNVHQNRASFVLSEIKIAFDLFFVSIGILIIFHHYIIWIIVSMPVHVILSIVILDLFFHFIEWILLFECWMTVMIKLANLFVFPHKVVFQGQEPALRE